MADIADIRETSAQPATPTRLRVILADRPEIRSVAAAARAACSAAGNGIVRFFARSRLYVASDQRHPVQSLPGLRDQPAQPRRLLAQWRRDLGRGAARLRHRQRDRPAARDRHLANPAARGDAAALYRRVPVPAQGRDRADHHHVVRLRHHLQGRDGDLAHLLPAARQQHGRIPRRSISTASS